MMSLRYPSFPFGSASGPISKRRIAGCCANPAVSWSRERQTLPHEATQLLGRPPQSIVTVSPTAISPHAAVSAYTPTHG